MSAASKSSPPTPIVAGARGDSPREVDPSLEVDYECDSDERAESLRRVESPAPRRAGDYEPSKPNVQKGTLFKDMFGSDDESSSSSVESKPMAHPKPAPHVRGENDGASHRQRQRSNSRDGSSYRGYRQRSDSRDGNSHRGNVFPIRSRKAGTSLNLFLRKSVASTRKAFY